MTMLLPDPSAIDTAKLSRDYKATPLTRGEKPLKEDLTYLYIDLNLSISKVAAYFNRSKDLMPKWNAFYSIRKPKHLQVALAEEVWLKKYGVKSARQAPEVKKKIRETLLSRYGRDNIFKGEEGKKYAAERCFKKLGRKNAFSGEEGKKLAEEGRLKKYGVRHSLKCPTIKAKAAKTNLVRYGASTTFILAKKCPVSKKELKWLSQFRTTSTSYKIKLSKKYITVDGFDETTNTVFEFLGDFWHGNLNKFKAEDLNPLKGKTYRELNEATFRRFSDLKLLGYNIKYVWESDFDANNAAVQNYC